MNRRRRKKAARKHMKAQEPWSSMLMLRGDTTLTARLGRREQEYILRRWEPERVWSEAHINIGIFRATAITVALPRQFGFYEASDELRAARDAIAEPVWQGRRAPILAALNRYLDLAEAQVDTLSDQDHARENAVIGLILAQARIWFQAREVVRWLSNLLNAETYARNKGYCALAGVLGVVLDNYRGTPVILQVEERFDEAIDGYLTWLLVRLSDRQRGLVNLLLAKCCQELLMDEPPNAAWVQRLLEMSLRGALTFLEGQPERQKALGMLADLQADTD